VKIETKGYLLTILLFPITLLISIVILAIMIPTIGLVGLIGGDEEWMAAPFITAGLILSYPYYMTISDIENSYIGKEDFE